MPGKRIMIVDDSTIMRKVISRFLNANEGIEVCAEAKDGSDALKQLRQSKPDLILLDLEMPNMTGLEFLRHAKLKSRAKIVILSSVAGLGSQKAQDALRLGANGIVSKPSGAVSMSLDNECGKNLLTVISQALS